MPPQNVHFFRSFHLVLSQQAIQRQIAKDLFTAPPILPLPKPSQLRQASVELSEQPAASTLLGNRVCGRRWRTRKKAKQAPPMTGQFDRTVDSRRDRPSQRSDAAQEAEFIVDVVNRLRPTTQNQPFTARANQPVLIEPSAQWSC